MSCPPTKVACNVCQESFESAAILRIHKSNEHTAKDNVCESCGYTTKNTNYFKKHVIKHTNKLSKKATLKKTHNIIPCVSTSLECNICHKIFNNVVTLRSHKSNKHTGKDKVCETCGYITKKTHDFKRHVLKHTNEYTIKCTYCSKGFGTKYEFQEHLNVHTLLRPYQCELCGVSYSRRSSLVLHRNRKHPELFDPSQRCSICNAVYLTKDAMDAHTMLHSEGRNRFQCDICGKGLLSQTILKIHRRTHTGEKPYDCSYCGRAFSCKKNLSVHIRLHTGERPYECRFCWKSYTKSSALKTHEKTHCKETPWLIR